jgi:zona occludens toxin
MQARWEKHPEESRSVFVHGVKDLALPHSPLPLKEVTISRITYQVPDWEAVPDGSYALIDEAQSMFPPRASGSTMPEHVAFLNTHRHHGLDITIITQHPRLIDTAVRALVGKHQHFRRLWGGTRAMVYEWDSCSDNLGGLANAVTSYFPFPKDAYKFYKSAEVHTKQKFKLPRWLIIPFVGVALGAVAAPYAYNRITGLSNQDKAKASILAAGGVNVPVPSIGASGVLPGASAPSLAQVAPPTFAGCMSRPGRCQCFGMDGRLVEVTPERCETNVGQSGHDVPYLTAGSRNVDAAMTRLALPSEVAQASPPLPSVKQ